MGWLRPMFLGDLGNWMDTEDNAHRIRKIRAHVSSKTRVDRTQNQRLVQLERETDELKVCLTAMAHLLVSKGVLSRSEIAGFVGPIEDQAEGSA